MFADIGVLRVDHVAVTTNRFEETARHYLSMPHARVLRGPGWNDAQKVHFLFVSFGGDLCVEILGLPEDGDSPIAAHVAQGGGAYHLCHAVHDLDEALAAAEALGARVIVPAKADGAYDGRRVAFLMHPAHGVFELLEAYGSLGPVDRPATRGAPPPAAPVPSKARAELEAALGEAFAAIFKDALPPRTADWTSKTVKRWDSLQHMRLVMEIERRLDLVIPSRLLGTLKSYDDILDYLAAQNAA